MQTLRDLAHYNVLGFPLWLWALGVMPVVNELINRSKWTKAQSIWQFLWRFVAATPLSKVPAIGSVIQMMALPIDQRDQKTMFPEEETTRRLGPSILVLFFLSHLTACGATLEVNLYRGAHSVGSAADGCFSVLDVYDEATQKKIQQTASAGDAWDRFTAWKKIRTDALNTCKAGRLGAVTLQALIPSIMAAKDRDKQATAWLARVAQLVADITKAIDDIKFAGAKK